MDTEKIPPEQPEEPSEKKGKQVRDWIKAFFIALAFFLVLRLFIFDINEVRGSSMEPSLEKGDKVFIDKITYMFSDPSCGDIIVFKKPGSNKRLIKRIVACPGDIIDVEEGQLTVNGVQLEEPYVLEANAVKLPSITISDDILFVGGKPVFTRDPEDESVYAEEEPEQNRIPSDRYLVFGDNRLISLDSRNWGLLDEEQIVGKARIRFRLFPPFLKTVE